MWGKQSGRKISRKETSGEINRATATKKTSVGPKDSGKANGEVMVRTGNVKFCLSWAENSKATNRDL